MKYDDRFSSFCRTVSFKKIPKQSKLIHPQLFHLHMAHKMQGNTSGLGKERIGQRKAEVEIMLSSF
jgi:hypothetical protein